MMETSINTFITAFFSGLIPGVAIGFLVGFLIYKRNASYNDYIDRKVDKIHK